MRVLPQASLALAASTPTFRSIHPKANPSSGQCRSVDVAVLGAGVSGIIAAQALHNNSITDFVIIESNDYIGGRMMKKSFGRKKDGTSYTVELGANYIQGITSDKEENPIWTLAKKVNLTTVPTDGELLTFDENGPANFSNLVDEQLEAMGRVAQWASENRGNGSDPSLRDALRHAGWAPENAHMDAVDFLSASDPNAQPAEAVSAICLTEVGYCVGDVDAPVFNLDNTLFAADQRGFSVLLVEEAYTFLKPNDPRLLLDTIVERIDHDQSGVTIRNHDGSCVSADRAIVTFSIGVLQHQLVDFSPALPDWKQTAIDLFTMGIYTKIFIQFEESFWPTDAQLFLYADPTRYGYYAEWVQVGGSGDLRGSNILMAVVVGENSRRVERQTDDQTKDELLGVLRNMFPDAEIPEPIDFMYPRWGSWKGFYGSYSNVPPGYSLAMRQDLRKPVGRVHFAGEALAADFGYLHGAWYSGRDVGTEVARLQKLM